MKGIDGFSRDEFEALAWTERLGSVERAAERMGCSADGVRVLIRSLEYRLSMKFFEQGDIAETLTPEGVIVARHASIVLEQLDKIMVGYVALE